MAALCNRGRVTAEAVGDIPIFSLLDVEMEMFSEETIKIKKQIENAMSIFDELMMIRKKKLLGLVFVASETGINKKDFENMLDFEKELFDEMIVLMKGAEKKLNSQFNNKIIEQPVNELLKLVLFLDKVEEFVGLDGERVGPFQKGQIANLPREIAQILIADGKAEIIEE